MTALLEYFDIILCTAYRQPRKMSTLFAFTWVNVLHKKSSYYAGIYLMFSIAYNARIILCNNITMTALLEYLDLFIQIQVAEKLSSQCRTVSLWAPALLTTAIDSIMCGTVMLSSSKKFRVPKLRPAQLAYNAGIFAHTYVLPYCTTNSLT